MPTIEDAGCEVQRDGTESVVKGNTFPIKEQLKSRGGKWDPDSKSWRFANTSPRKVERYVVDAVSEIQGNDNRFKYFSDVEPAINEAQDVWNEQLKRFGICTQSSSLSGAGVKAFYVAHGERNPKFHFVIRYSDPKLAKYAENAASVLRSFGVETKHERGTKW
jgi:hypothetical protein